VYAAVILFATLVAHFMKKKAFTLIELLVVVAIISLLVSILMPSLAKAKTLAKRTACMSGMHAIGTGALMYSGDFSEQVPIAYKNFDPNDPLGNVKNPWKCWRVNLRPYVGSYQVFNCPAAADTGTVLFHNEDELTAITDNSGSATRGSIGIMELLAVSLYTAPDYAGDLSIVSPITSNSFSIVPGRTWMDPNNSIYCADAWTIKNGLPRTDIGASFIYPPTPDPNYYTTYNRCFADRHAGANCLFLDSRVQSYPTKTLEGMKYGDPSCVWDGY